MTTTVVHEWCSFVDKADVVVHKQMVLNKLWIPDVLIDIIKDYLFISAEVVLRNYYKTKTNKIIMNLGTDVRILRDNLGEDRVFSWRIAHRYIDHSRKNNNPRDNIYLNGAVCATCGEFSSRHLNNTGCCPRVGDGDELELEIVDIEVSDETIFEINNTPDSP
jgi:hypothetical protein